MYATTTGHLQNSFISHESEASNAKTPIAKNFFTTVIRPSEEKLMLAADVRGVSGNAVGAAAATHSVVPISLAAASAGLTITGGILNFAAGIVMIKTAYKIKDLLLGGIGAGFTAFGGLMSAIGTINVLELHNITVAATTIAVLGTALIGVAFGVFGLLLLRSIRDFISAYKIYTDPQTTEEEKTKAYQKMVKSLLLGVVAVIGITGAAMSLGGGPVGSILFAVASGLFIMSDSSFLSEKFSTALYHQFGTSAAVLQASIDERRKREELEEQLTPSIVIPVERPPRKTN